MNHYLFVYGTLRREFENDMAEYLNRHAEYWKDGYLKGYLFDVDSYPGFIYDDKAEILVKGQIFKLNDAEEVFSVLDPYEGVDDELYIRQICPVHITDKEVLPCWVYTFNRSTLFLKKIESGDYLEYQKTKHSME